MTNYEAARKVLGPVTHDVLCDLWEGIVAAIEGFAYALMTIFSVLAFGIAVALMAAPLVLLIALAVNLVR